MLSGVRKGKHVYRFKGFDSTECGDSMSALEEVVNSWMREEHPQIRHMGQSMRGEHILLSFVYEDTPEQVQNGILEASVENDLSDIIGSTGGFPRIFDDELPDIEPATNPRIPATPPM